MCKQILSDQSCSIRRPLKDGRRDVGASVAINQAFKEAVLRSPNYKESKLGGGGCGGYRCCFVASPYVTWTDCPYYESI